MSKKRSIPGPAARITAILLSFVMMLLLLGGMALTTVHSLLTNEALHRRVALDDRVLDAQTTRIEKAVHELAAVYAFSPETVLNRLSRASLEEYNQDVIAWWMGLLMGESDPEAPVYNTSQIQTAVRSDPFFQEQVEEDLRLHVARDQVGYGLSDAVLKAVMPIRMSLVQLALPIAMEKIDFVQLLSLVHKAGWLMMALPLALALVLLLCTRSLRWMCACMSGVLYACALVMIMLGGLIQVSGLLPMIAGMSEALALQLTVFGGQMMMRFWFAVLLLLLAGTLLAIPGRRRQRIRYVPRRRRED